MDIAEKRVYEEQSGRTRLAVGTGAGLAVVGISGDVIGEFGLAVRESVRDVAVAGDDRVLVATGEDVVLVQLGPNDGGVAETERVAETGAGAADAVAIHDERVIVAGSDGVVRRAPLADVGGHEDSPSAAETDADDDAATNASDAAWESVGEATVRAADGQLLAAADGVYRVDVRGIDHVGLDDVRDVAAAGPLAATADGCFRLGPGWTMELGGGFDVVAAAALPADADATEHRAHAAAGSALHERRPDDDWTAVELPTATPIAGVAYGSETYAVSVDGTVLVETADGWRTRSIGLPDVACCAVVR